MPKRLHIMARDQYKDLSHEKKKIKKRERKSLGLKFGSKREEKIKEHGKEYRKIDINGCLMIREKCKRVHEIIQCIEKKNNSKLI